MCQNKMLFMLFVICWSCLIAVSGVAAPKGPLRSHITGGFKNIQTRNSRSDLDCSQFSDDYDVLYHFSFLIMINPINSDWSKSTAQMNDDGTLVTELVLKNENAVPLSIFCLQSLERLDISNMPFPDGIVPDDLGNLKQLHSLVIYSSPIINMTERLGTLNNLYSLNLVGCALTHLPNLSGISRLSIVSLSSNQLFNVDGLTDVFYLDLSYNLFTDIPTLNTSATLQHLNMNNNPLKNMLAITSHVNLYTLQLSNTNLSYIPATIDRLQNLHYLYLGNNKLFYLPTNMLKLTKLKILDIQSNSFSSADIEAFKTRFNETIPTLNLFA